MSSIIYEARAVTKSFKGVTALSDVALSLRAGEIHSLMGENGAGKSTLIKVISGIHKPDQGTLLLNGAPVDPTSNHQAQKLGISTVFQEVNLIPTLTVAENIYLGREPKKWACIDWRAMREGAERALSRLDLKLDVMAPLEDYPIAIQQMTAIARALDLNAKVLILDEATSSLDRHEVQSLFNVLRRLRADGLAILFVSHFLDQIYEISDRITVLRNGAFIGEWKIADLDRTSLISKMMGRELATLEPNQKTTTTTGGDVKPWLKCQSLSRTGKVEPLNLELFEGETLGLAGLLGSGRTEIARLLFGLDKPDGGTIEINGEPVHFSSPQEAIKQGFALCPEDRKHASVFPGLSVRENIMLALQAHRGWMRRIAQKDQIAIADKFISALGIRVSSPEQPIETLSGGNQQKAILARWLALEPRLLLLDEPTRGIDVGAKAEILNFILNLVSQGKSVLFISSELEEVVRLCDRVAVLKDHRKVADLERPSITESAVMSAIGEST